MAAALTGAVTWHLLGFVLKQGIAVDSGDHQVMIARAEAFTDGLRNGHWLRWTPALPMTEPIRIDDVVIVEGEWGWIEEIRSTYVVVRIWDLRRLVVPLSYFIEHPFQNWTRKTADILGTVFVYADYTVPVDAVRKELRRILDSDPLWDKKVWGLQVTDAKQQTVELRALMSATDSGKAWDLRCHVREALLDFMQREYPGSLPRVRAELDRAAEHADTERGSALS
jgi:hypothetical protein